MPPESLEYIAGFYGVLGAADWQTQNAAALAALDFTLTNTYGPAVVLPDNKFLLGCWAHIKFGRLHEQQSPVGRVLCMRRFASVRLGTWCCRRSQHIRP